MLLLTSLGFSQSFLVFPSLLLSHLHIFTFQGSRLPSVGDADDFPDHGDGIFSDERVREGDDSAVYEAPGAHAGRKSKHLGTLYSHILLWLPYTQCSRNILNTCMCDCSTSSNGRCSAPNISFAILAKQPNS